MVGFCNLEYATFFRTIEFLYIVLSLFLCPYLPYHYINTNFVQTVVVTVLGLFMWMSVLHAQNAHIILYEIRQDLEQRLEQVEVESCKKRKLN